MKTFLTSIAALFALAIQATAAVGGHEGNGGAGCIAANGGVITFYDCGFYKPAPLQDPNAPAQPLPIDAPSENPPGLQDLTDFIKTTGYIDADTRKALLDAVTPTVFRKYFSAAPPALDSTEQGRILFEFKRPTGMDPAKMQLFGVTDTRAQISYSNTYAKITYLLPGFYQLKTREERMAALFHEAYWVLNENADYPDAIAAEMTAQALFENPQDPKRQLDFIDMLQKVFPDEKGLGMYDVKLWLKMDISSGALTGFVNSKNQMTNLQLFGLDNLKCLDKVAAESDSSNDKSKDTEACYIGYIQYLNGLRLKYPNSVFLNRIGQLIIYEKQQDPENYDTYWSYQNVFRKLFYYIEGDTFKDASWKDKKDCHFLGSCADYRVPADPLELKLFTVNRDPNSGDRKTTEYDAPNEETVTIQLNVDGGDSFPMTLAR